MGRDKRWSPHLQHLSAKYGEETHVVTWEIPSPDVEDRAIPLHPDIVVGNSHEVQAVGRWAWPSGALVYLDAQAQLTIPKLHCSMT